MNTVKKTTFTPVKLSRAVIAPDGGSILRSPIQLVNAAGQPIPGAQIVAIMPSKALTQDRRQHIMAPQIQPLTNASQVSIPCKVQLAAPVAKVKPSIAQSTVVSPFITPVAPSAGLSCVSVESKISPAESTHLAAPSVGHSQNVIGQKRTYPMIADHLYRYFKRRKLETKGKGLRYFSLKVCQKVQEKKSTTYNEVADELVAEFSDPYATLQDQQYEQKNIRRRVYDALNVLMAMNIITKERKEIRWIGLPTDTVRECRRLSEEKQRRYQVIQEKTQTLYDLIAQLVACKQLIERNRAAEKSLGPPPPNTVVPVPFLVISTDVNTVVDCHISPDKTDYEFTFNDTFALHDHLHVMSRLGLTFGLDKRQVKEDDVARILKLVPPKFHHYVREMTGRQRPGAAVAAAGSNVESSFFQPPFVENQLHGVKVEDDQGTQAFVDYATTDVKAYLPSAASCADDTVTLSDDDDNGDNDSMDQQDEFSLSEDDEDDDYDDDEDSDDDYDDAK